METTDQLALHPRFSVDFDFPVLFGRDFFGKESARLAGVFSRRGGSVPHRVLVVVEAGVENAHPDLALRIRAFFDAQATVTLVRELVVLPGGERIKNDYRMTMQLVDIMLEHRMCRHSFVVAIGGGALLDAAGFAVALVHRGLRLIRMPTTVLAQNDAGVGVKNAMNLHGGKNTIGTFAPPFAVVNDFSFLGSLPPREWTGGIAEAFKVAIIKDAVFFRELCAMAPRLRARDEVAMERLIIECARLHLEHITTNGDPFEFGEARPLDFGHWAAHKLESMTSYALSHGEAVAIGIALDSWVAVRQGRISKKDWQDIVQGLSESGFRLWHPVMDRRMADGTHELLGGLADFQEHLGGRLNITLPQGLGAKIEVHEMEPRLVAEALDILQSHFAVC